MPPTSLAEDVSEGVGLWLAVCELVPVTLLLLVTEPEGVADEVCRESKPVTTRKLP
jgi:hypothetical protein